MKDDYEALEDSSTSCEEYVNELISLFEDTEHVPFKWEYAHESITERGSQFRRIAAVN